MWHLWGAAHNTLLNEDTWKDFIKISILSICALIIEIDFAQLTEWKILFMKLHYILNFAQIIPHFHFASKHVPSLRSCSIKFNLTRELKQENVKLYDKGNP